MDDRLRFDVEGATILQARKPTAQLWKLEKQGKTPSTDEEERLVEEGADVNWQPDARESPTLMWFCLHYPPRTACIIACLSKSELAIDYTLLDYFGSSFLLQISENDSFSSEEATAVLQAVVRRVEQHQKDQLECGAQNPRGDQFIVMAAANQRLSYFFPLIRHLPY